MPRAPVPGGHAVLGPCQARIPPRGGAEGEAAPPLAPCSHSRLPPSFTTSLDSQGGQDTERGPAPLKERPGPVADVSTTTLTCLSWIKRPYEFYTAPVVKFWFHTVGGPQHLPTLVLVLL